MDDLPIKRPAGSNPTYFPTPETAGGWRKNTTPEFVRGSGIDPRRLAAFGAFNLALPNNQWQPWSDHKAALVIKNGWMVGEWYEGEQSERFLQYLASNGKAFAMVCFGILCGDSQANPAGTQIGLDSLVYDPRWLPEGFPLSDPRKAHITFRQLFQHNSGICPEAEEAGRYQPDKDYRLWVVGRDARYPETAQLYYDPGCPKQYQKPNRHRFWTYSSVALQHIGLVLANLAGIPAHRFLEERLLQPLGIAQVGYFQPVDEWSAGEANRSIRWHSEGGLRLAARDYARFAYLLLHDGWWQGQQLVPAEYLRQFRTTESYANILGNAQGGFGAQYPPDLFRIAGAGCSWAFMAPSLDLIALRAGRSDDALAGPAEAEFLKKLFEMLT